MVVRALRRVPGTGVVSATLPRRLHHAGRGMIGKNHLATTLAYEACLTGHRVLFTPDIDIVNVAYRRRANEPRLQSGRSRGVRVKPLC